ncbi:MAG: SUF system NifU family Fe-S cluster assembly protein [Gammaproteobacteria bacterium]|nr:SUF system NifU family Fe-S cluster assembly protein [Gammaproteobacteria bacterium]NNM21345.1 SUF system NifU family Fe-S cluster assembly protein [Gammaproteobacteria bacterium]
MMELADLYRDVILDHNKTPRNFRRIEPATHTARGFNPLCGDKLTVYLVMDDDIVNDVAFEGTGCAISVASSSLMTEAVKGKTESQARELFGQMHELLAGNGADAATLGKLAALGGVRQFPTRVKCASLAWHALAAALDGENEAKTE